MSKSMVAGSAAAILLFAAPALAEPASGLVPEQGAAAAQGPEQSLEQNKSPPCCGEPVTFAADAPKDPTEVGPVHLARTPFGAIGSSLPEPASWGLMIVGFGGMGAILRNHRRAAARP